ncbi:vacuolar amino acid transporter 4-like isoform X2 [Patiria miniata]|uniref:Amino acid transporter transmembrane domain-containing protein n=1 Tax=Patiria miniata TaxID=46514 RepID=A0A914AMY8_PATMI|nr:vacuolar amino acid transporter 4-like isoform X2 [Patiria miniata]
MARKLKRCLNILMDFANLFKAFIGVNYLSIAFAIGQSGIALGIIGLLLIAVATVHGCHLLIKCKRQVIQNIVRANFPIGSQSTDDDDGAHKRGLLCNIMEKQLSYDFCVADSISWFKFDKLKTFPIFFGQVTGSYEGIGTIVPIESSMDGNHHLFAPLLYLTIVVFTFVLGSMGFIGYLHLGDCTAQVLIWNLAPGSLLQLLVSLVVCIGVVFTFPLQCFPVIEVFEELVFIKGKCCSSKPVSVNSDAEEDTTEVGVASSSQDDVGELQQLLQDPEVTNILEKLPVATQVPQSVSAWKRNILRTTIVVAQLGCAYAFKDQFAYFSALTGAIGSTLLAFVIPALLHIKLKRQELGSFIIIKDVMLIIFGIVGGVSGVYASVLSIIQHTNTPCSASC